MLSMVRCSALCLSFFAAAQLTFGQTPPPAEKAGQVVKVAGKVRKRGGVATIQAKGGETYKIVLDEKGRSLLKVMNGTYAEVRGIVSFTEGAKWLRVTGYVSDTMTAAHELWRRMQCNACAVVPAVTNAAAPADLQGATAVSGRYYPQREKFAAWTRDVKHLWVSADTRLVQIDLSQKRVVRTFGRKDGLPDRIVYQLLSDGGTVWIVYRGGVAALTIGQDKIVDLPRLKSSYAAAFADGGATWIIATTGTYRMKGAGQPPAVHPPLPTAERIAKLVDRGVWLPHWTRKTGHLITTPAGVGDRLYVGSYGDLYELADGQWRKLAKGGWELRAAAGRLWFISSKGLAEYDPASGKRTDHEPPADCRGRYTRLLMAAEGAWLAAEPGPGSDKEGAGGGLARFDLASRQWQGWSRINDHQADRIACLAPGDGVVWAVCTTGIVKQRSAHPGMTYVKRKLFEATGFHLDRFDPKHKRWDSYPLAMADLEDRLICGQDGGQGRDAILPKIIEGICAGPKRIFGQLRLMPRQYFSGYWPSVNQVASRAGPDAAWTAKFEHHPEQLNLQGEQPPVLNISNKGEMILEAVGHDNVLGLFLHDGAHWAVTEGCVGCFDEAAGRWAKLAETGYHFYWRATAAVDDGRSVYLGSDRGLVSRLDLDTGRSELMVALTDRAVSRMAKSDSGGLWVATRPAPLGALPVLLRGKVEALECEVAAFDGKAWAKAAADDMPSSKEKPRWFLKRVGKRVRFDRSQGNFLWGPVPGARKPKPKYYLKDIYFPHFLCASPDGRRLWLSTYTGLVRVDCGRPDAGMR